MKSESLAAIGMALAIAGLALAGPAETAFAQDAPPPGTAPASAVKGATATPAPNAATNATSAGASAVTNRDGATGGDAGKPSGSEDIQLSFQQAQIDMVVQWLAQTTGKSVIKHPQVNVQLTIVSSKKLPPREAINLVYRALSIEGYTAVESSSSILIVPEGKEPKMNPELISADKTGVPDGRQRLIKIFPLKHIQAADLRDKIGVVLSEKASIDTDERANQLIVTDYNDNLRLLGEMIAALDVESVSDSTVEIYPLKNSEAEELGNLVSLVVNAQSGGGGGGGGGTSRSGGSSSPRSMRSLPGGGPPMMIGDSGAPSGGGPTPAGGAAGGGGNQVRIWPDKTANRLIVAAPKAKQAEVQRLINVLDTEKPQDVTLRVIPLKNVNAEDIAKEIGPLYQRMSGRSLKDMIEVTADSRSSSLIILSSEANFQAVKRLLTTLDTEEAQEKVVRTFTLKNADSEDVAKQIQDLYKDQDSSSRYIYYFTPQTSSGSKKLKVVADRRRNTLIVQAPPSSMESVGKMIDELDAPVTDNSLAPKIIRLKYVSATDIEDVLNELFLKKTQQRSYYDFFSDTPSETADHDVGRLYGKVRITSEPFSNSIILASNSPENLAAVEDVLRQLDAPSEAGESTLRIQLKFAKAFTVANSLNILFAKGGSPALRPPAQPGQPPPQNQQQQQPTKTSQPGFDFDVQQEVKDDSYYPWLGGQQENVRGNDGRTTARPVSDLVGRVRAVSDQRSNALLVSCNVHFFPQVLKLIEDLDAPTASVLIDMKIVEVSSDLLHQLGVRWGPDGSTSFSQDDFDNGILLKTSGEYRKSFGGGGAAALANSLKSGVLDGTLNLDFLIQFLKRNTDATVLGEPQINVEDNEVARLFVGSQVPFQSGSINQALGGSSQTLEYRDVGVKLEVTPHINNSEDVALRIHAESSTLRQGANATLFNAAIIDTRNFRTDLMSKNGQTLVMGGIIQKQLADTLRKVPLLGDIPVLGWAFKKKDKVSHETELMVFLRPRITRTPEQAKELMEEMDRKAPLIKKWRDADVPLGDPSLKPVK